MSLSSILPALPGVYTQKSNPKQKALETTSNAASSIHSKKSKYKHQAEAEKQKAEAEAEAKAAKDREEQCVRLYEMWSKIKQEEKDEHYQYLKERVSIQHELIKRQDMLFKKRQAKIEQKRWQLREAKRLARMAKSKEYSDFVRDVLAQDRKKALSLKSHVRVISSHEPERVSQLRRDTRSSYDSTKSHTPGHSSLDSSGPSGIESSLLTDNFKELLLDPVDVQLQKLLGSDAEDFLHPTFREGAKKTLNPVVVHRKLSGIGARELWGTLRNNSQFKLEKQDDTIPPDVKNAYKAFLRECLHNNIPTVRRSFCKDGEDVFEEDRVSESQLIQDIKFTRHRLELMFRVAHMNRDKTKLLVKTVDPGEPSEGTVSRPPRYNPQQILEIPMENRAAPLPALALTDAEGEHHSLHAPLSPREPTQEPEKEPDVIVGGEKIKFLTEKMATCKGEFSKRHKAPGCSTEMAPISQGPSKGINVRGTLSAPASSMGAREAKKSQGRPWEPLSLSALLEYNAPVGVPGSGEFLLGQTKTWKIQ
ncbi:hypothetical protein ACROYT_G033589 [Oculina patagonica]